MIFVFTVIAVAYACRILGKFDIGGVYTNYVRSALYLLLFAWWGFTLDRRIIQKRVLHCLRLTALLMLLWLVLRTLKYHVVTGVTAARYVWYLYYLPMLFLPLLGVYIALLLGKPEEYRLPGRARLLAIIPTVLFLLVITNDLHQWAFAFKDGVPGRPVSSAFTHRLLYFVCLVWMVACITFSLVRLFRKSRIPGGARKRLTPFVLGCVTLLYGLLYLSGLPAVRWWFGDMNVMLCLLYAALYESCIRCRMIPSNTGYAELFEASTLAACIADPDGQIILRSRAAGEDMVCPREGQRLIRPDGMRISSAPIGGGYVVWQDNVRPLLELHTKLNENKAELESNRKKLQDAYLVQKKLHELTEKNQKLTRFGAHLYVAEDIGLVAFTQVDYKILIFGKTTRACVYRIADLRNYKYEEKMVKNGDKTEKKSTVRLVFINTEGMNAFNLEVNNFKEYEKLSKYFDTLFGVQKTLGNAANTWKQQMTAIKDVASGLSAAMRGEEDAGEKAAAAINSLDAAVYGDRTEWIRRADAALAAFSG